ncbi:hypothetical protein BASA81_001560 [Batrachochytrium salamandrivorans]|nr:hypothetical protein BASA81_001560 [Batrachochytrium salamandrivorans]
MAIAFPQEMSLNDQPAQTFALSTGGLVCTSRGDLVVVPLSRLVGVTRTGARLNLVSYDLDQVQKGGCCCWPKSASTSNARARNVDVLDCGSDSVATEWERQVWDLLLPPSRRNRKHTHERHFLVFLNPNSGVGDSHHIYNQHCAMTFQDAGIKTTILITDRAGHASEYCESNADIPNLDGIVVVSGDGMMFECLQGLMKRPDWAAVMQTVALGIIPAGSGNGLAHSVAHLAGGMMGSPLVNAVLIAKGNKSPLDICMIDHASRGRLYSFLSLEYGIACEVDIGSEYMRSLGEVRFTLQVLKLLVNPHSTRVKLSYLPATSSPKLDSYWDCGGSIDPQGPQSLLPADSESEWEIIEDSVYLMWNCNVAWMSSSAHVAPTSRANDGHHQICLYRKQPLRDRARIDMAKFFIALENGSHVEMPRLEMFPTRAYCIEPIPPAPGKHQTMVAVDGEEVPLERMRFEILPGLATIMGLPTPPSSAYGLV